MLKLEDLKNQRINLDGGSLYVGDVTDNDDPEQLQRVRVNVPGVHVGVSGDKLPWCALAGGLGGQQGNQGTNVGVMGVPRVGARVLVLFMQDDPYHPLVIGSATVADQKVGDLLPGYPNSFGYKDTSGNVLLVNTDDGTFSYKHHSGTKVMIEKDGSVVVTGQKDVTVNAQGNVAVDATGNMDLRAGGEMSLTASRINLNS